MKKKLMKKKKKKKNYENGRMKMGWTLAKKD